MARDTTTTTARSPRRAARLGRLAAVAVLLGCQALPPGASSPTADGFYRDAGRGHGYPRPEAEILQAVEREDLPTLRRHGWDLWAALTQEGRDGFPAFLTWYQSRAVLQGLVG